MKGKPTPEGYKVFALCDSGYTWTFLPVSRVTKSNEIENDDESKLGVIARLVIHLVNNYLRIKDLMCTWTDTFPVFHYSAIYGPRESVRAELLAQIPQNFQSN